MPNQEQLTQITNGKGFIAALDQSGGSTPKALKNYGVEESAYNGEDEMFAKVHEMRTRIITAPAFAGGKILGAILFEKTMDSEIDGKPTAAYLAENLGVAPFLKIDKGLADIENGVQMMKPMPDLDALLEKAKTHNIFGTKMRSAIHEPNPEAIAAVVQQQFDIAKRVIGYGMVPIIEPEVDINAPQKAECEDLMVAEFKKQLDALEADQKVMLKLTLPEKPGLFADLIAHDNVARVVALSGGYSLEESCDRLSKNDGMIASFSRALTNSLNVNQSDEEFNTALQSAINKIYDASVAEGANSAAA